MVRGNLDGMPDREPAQLTAGFAIPRSLVRLAQAREAELQRLPVIILQPVMFDPDLSGRLHRQNDIGQAAAAVIGEKLFAPEMTARRRGPLNCEAQQAARGA